MSFCPQFLPSQELRAFCIKGRSVLFCVPSCPCFDLFAALLRLNDGRDAGVPQLCYTCSTAV